MEEKIFIKNNKGFTLAALLNTPSGNGPFPAVLILHGFTGYKEEEHLASLANFLSEQGFVAIRFDMSSFGESEGDTKDYSLSYYLEDIEAVFNYVKTCGFINRSKLFLAGHSMGALATVIFATKHPELRGVVIISSPILMATTDWLESMLPQWKQTGYFEKISSKYGKVRIPYAFIEDAQKYNALDFVKNMHVPSLFVVGLADDVVSPIDSRKVFEKANSPKELYEVAGMDHDYKKHTDIMDRVNTKIYNFFTSIL